MAGNRVICLGCAFWDTILRVDHVPVGGAKIFAREAVRNASGMATAAAVTIARLGGEVALWTRIGDDPTGRLFLDDIAGEGVAIGHVRRLPGGTTWFSTILVDAAGERLVVAHPSPLDEDPSWLPLDALAGAGAVLCDMRWAAGARAVLERARTLGVPTILDADVAPVEDLRSLAPLADHVLFSEPALASLTDMASPERAVRTVAADLDARVVGVTLGERGSVLWERGAGDGTVHRVPAPRIRAVDTLNAGDVWHGTYAYGLVQGWGLERIARTANVAAAMKCEHFGGRVGAPRLSALRDRLERWEAEGSP